VSNVIVSIHPVLQRAGTHHCWAAVVAMMQSRAGADDQTIIHQVISEARDAGVPMNGDTLSEVGGPQALAQAFGFACIDLRAQDVQDGNYFANFLHQCPFGLFGQRPRYGLHAIAINRLNGDFTSLSSTHAYGIDPIGGRHPFMRSLYQLVMPEAQIEGEMCGHYVLWR
jgi:hypothetical protein